VISIVLGNFNDKREIQAAHDKHKTLKHLDDFKNEEELWIDYVADLGDGFDATFTVAWLLAQEKIVLNGEVTERGSILIMGGDQVYPTASRKEYNDRLKGPYSSAFPYDKTIDSPHLFAIPGNHDWYDGLTNFLKVFCQQRHIGNWQTKQHRSYFALQLPYKVWFFGIDVSLNSDIDAGQWTYFDDILDRIENDSKVIICTAEPSWIYKTSNKEDAYKNLEYFEKKFANRNGKTNQILTLAGDLHHYARYKAERDESLKITAGGGGAFMHPTHCLPKEICGLREGTIKLKETFPSTGTSRYLGLRNLWFFITNWRFTLFMSVLYSIAGWLMYVDFIPDFKELTLYRVFYRTLFSPATCMLLLILLLGLTFFAETKPFNPRIKKGGVYRLFGFGHGIIQVFMIPLTFWIVVGQVMMILKPSLFMMFMTIFGMSLLGSFIGPFIFGGYLIFANQVLGNHNNEAYSSLKWTGYKNFIRLHITKDKLRIFPIGVKKVSKWMYVKENGKGNFNTKLKPEAKLIDQIVTIQL
ncbi:MAG: metallophosphoesterase, partial [Bacteroidetes bacterium]|nr:metallophosphoesterase [Bacteroidota bacterium]